MAARRGHTLTRDYGQISGLGKVFSLITRKSVSAKFAKVIADLKALIPAAAAAPPPAASPSPPPSAFSSQHPPQLSHAATSPTLPPESQASSSLQAPPLSGIHSTSAPCAADADKRKGGSLATRSRRGGLDTISQLVGGSHGLPHNLSGNAAHAGPPVGLVVRDAKHDTVHALTYVPASVAGGHVCIWWSAGNSLEFWSEASRSSTSFPMEVCGCVCVSANLCGDGAGMAVELEVRVGLAAG